MVVDNTINNDITMGGAAVTLLAGRYRVVRQLGQGGMGSVWLAEDTKLDGFKVAIKMLPSILVNNKRAYAQVKAEALVSLKLVHPNIVQVRAFEDECGNPFLVMDYIDGQTLDDYLAEKGKLTEEETIRLLKPVAAALDYAHQQGVVHRDVKPGNIMIRKDGVPFVLDFGIAREIQETMTRVTGKLSSGTLMYMSPEQLNGAAPKPAQDVYSFAAMAYECLKGHPPFSRGQIEYQIENDTPLQLSASITINSGVMSGLAKEPQDRPSSCVAILRLQTVVPSTPTYKKAWFRIAMLFALVVLAGTCVIFWNKSTHVRDIGRRRILSKLEWRCYSDDYYFHTEAEREAEKRKTGKEQALWSIPEIVGCSALFTEDRDDLKSAERFSELFKAGRWDEGWLELDRHYHADNPVWQFYRGVCIEHGYGGESKNLKNAIRYYRKAAKQGCVEALFNMGLSYERGDGVVKDNYRAACYYYRASLMGDDEAGKRWLEIRRRSSDKNMDPMLLLLNTFDMRRTWPDDYAERPNGAYLLLHDATGEMWCVPVENAFDFVAANDGVFECCFRFVDDEKDYYVSQDNLPNFQCAGKNLAIDCYGGKVTKASEKQVATIRRLFICSAHPMASGDPKDFLTDDEYRSLCKLVTDAALEREFDEKYGTVKQSSLQCEVNAANIEHHKVIAAEKTTVTSISDEGKQDKHKLSLLAIKEGDFAKAKDLLRAAINVNQRDTEAIALLATAIIQQIDRSKSEEEKTELKKELEKDVVMHLKGRADSTLDFYELEAKGFVLLQQGEAEKEARDTFVLAMKLRPGAVSIQDTVLGLDISLDDKEHAERVAREIIKLNPTSSLANYVMGSLALARNDLVNAESHLRRAVEAQKPSALALNDLAEVLRRNKKFVEAELFARRATEQASELYVAWGTLGEILMDVGCKLDEAEECVSKACLLSKDKEGKESDIRMLVLLARVQISRNDERHAQETIRKVRERANELSEFEKKEFESVLSRYTASHQAEAETVLSPRVPIRPVYPKSSRSRGEEGDVVLSIRVDATGVAERVDVAVSSGFPDLDNAAVNAARAARFTPAEKGGKPIASIARLKLSFRLK